MILIKNKKAGSQKRTPASIASLKELEDQAS